MDYNYNYTTSDGMGHLFLFVIRANHRHISYVIASIYSVWTIYTTSWGSGPQTDKQTELWYSRSLACESTNGVAICSTMLPYEVCSEMSLVCGGAQWNELGRALTTEKRALDLFKLASDRDDPAWEILIRPPSCLGKAGFPAISQGCLIHIHFGVK